MKRLARTHYEILGIPTTASGEEIKSAYYQLAKQHHPDTEAGDEEVMREINAAYEVLRHQDSRHAYDQQLPLSRPTPQATSPQRRGATLTDEAEAQLRWVQQVYAPINRLLIPLFRSLRPQLNQLAADPFDDDLLADFCDYVDECTAKYQQARRIFEQRRNPSSLSGVATLLYYVLNHVEDALEEFRAFPLNYEDRHLHTGQELFLRANGLRLEAAGALDQKYVR
ncbi:MAG: J domain-containing protein [Synechococcales cyanobacterium]